MCVCVWCGVSVCKCKWGDLKPTHFHPPGATALLELAQNEMIKKPMERDQAFLQFYLTVNNFNSFETVWLELWLKLTQYFCKKNIFIPRQYIY